MKSSIIGIHSGGGGRVSRCDMLFQSVRFTRLTNSNDILHIIIIDFGE